MTPIISPDDSVTKTIDLIVGREKGNSATRPPDKRLMVLRPVSDPRVVTRDGAALFGIDANCHETLSQVGLPLRAIWHNGDIGSG